MDELLKLMIDDIKHQIELIKIHKKVCDILETQKTKLGMYVPPHIPMDYNDRQVEIKRLEKEVVEKTKRLPPVGVEGLTTELKDKIPDRVIISDSANVLVDTHINAGRDVIILHIASI